MYSNYITDYNFKCSIPSFQTLSCVSCLTHKDGIQQATCGSARFTLCYPICFFVFHTGSTWNPLRHEYNPTNHESSLIKNGSCSCTAWRFMFTTAPKKLSHVPPPTASYISSYLRDMVAWPINSAIFYGSKDQYLWFMVDISGKIISISMVYGRYI